MTFDPDINPRIRVELIFSVLISMNVPKKTVLLTSINVQQTAWVTYLKNYTFTQGSAIDFSKRHPHFSHCVNTEATYECECDEGYQENGPYVDAATYECTNIDECAANPCPPNSQEYFRIIIQLKFVL